MLKRPPNFLYRHCQRALHFGLTALLTLLLTLLTPGLIYQLYPVNASPTLIEPDRQARSRYNNRQFREAATLFREAAQTYQTQNNPIAQALSLSNLALCHQYLGEWPAANEAIQTSITLLQNTTQPGQATALAQTLDIQANLLLAQGQPETALHTWEQSTQLYQKLGQPDRAIASQTHQAQALQNLGLHRRAITLLQTALKLKTDFTNTLPSESLPPQLESLPPQPEIAMALHTLGESLRSMGNLAPANLILTRSSTIANSINRPDLSAIAQLSLGNIARLQGNSDQALNFYQTVANSPEPELRSQAQVNQFSLLIDTKNTPKALALLPQVQSQLATLPANRISTMTQINLAQTMMRLEKPPLSDIVTLLDRTTHQAQTLGDPRLQSYALGSLGTVYEQQAQWPTAAKYTQQALQLAHQVNASEIVYRWQWQLGRIAKSQGNTETAIAAYQGAVSTIKALRADIASASADVQFSFRDEVEPIHRQLVGLLLQSDRDNHLQKARDVIESLQLVELDNFFREACLNANPALIDQVDQKAAVIYPILLDDQLAIITSAPKADNPQHRDLHYYKTDIPRSEVENFAGRLRDDLDQPNTGELTLPRLQKMYDWLLRPAMTDLQTSKVETLVFVLDGALRNVPMAALHDGEKFLVERYSIALTPGLQLLSPKSLKQENLNVLVAGLTEARPPSFSALPNVANEVKTIQSEIPNQILLNQSFTNKNFQERLSAVPFPVLHLATHGQFSSQADETFILTWDDKLKVNQLSSVLQSTELSKAKALELLVLSACETAAGDSRSALGIAGVAIRSGARSTVATLWRINDEASAMLMGEFYSQLSQLQKTGISRAEALRHAQLAILNNPEFEKEPYFWAAYVMIGNWT